ncbi:MAG: ATP-binding protein [Verrucomicrobia bacterium]|nr:MAG: ATP-binding protein [Verrucomicrobiota bacterium]
MKPWREIIVPHPDVLNGTFQQSEFAADLTAVRTGKATPEYGDAKAFYERTFITEGMGRLLSQVALRLNGKGGEPVIQLQTAFGGGKTHTMLAVYHLATRKCPLGDLMGIPALLDQNGLLDVPQAQIAVLDGTAHSPGQPWKQGKQVIRTLWGEMAWQLGQAEGYALVKEADENGTSPGKEVLIELLSRFAPCVVLLDELVVYIRQFVESQALSGGTYDSNLSFIQSLTEAAKLVPNAVVLASLPESNSQAGGPRGVSALMALEAVFNRVQALWKTVAPEEAFEIVRRRLFEQIKDAKARDVVCRAFADAYVEEGAKVPQETQEARYYDRMVQSYPIHPEVFAQLYEEWTTIEGFQRTRGVLKLMAKTIFRLWQDNNKDLMILPGSLPLYDGSARNELIYYLGPGWDPVMDRDIDGEKAETTLLETKEPRFGSVQAARRVARTVFLSSAPSSVSMKSGTRGIDRSRIMLGCLQPGQTSSLYSDALNRLADQLHYMSSSGDKSQDTTRYWFDTRANLRREMEERKQRFEDKNEVRGRMAEVVKKLAAGVTFFEGTHIFTPHSDVPDDSALRLVILSPDHFYSKEEPRVAHEAVMDYVRANGAKPRYRGNRLLFLAPDHGGLTRLRDCIRVALAWNSIVEDVAAMRLVLDNLQAEQAKKELKSAEDVLPRVARECFKWLLCPAQDTPTAKPIVETVSLNTSGASLGAEMERVCLDNEWVIATWSPIHLRSKLQELYWKDGKTATKAADFWEDTLRYLYLPRLKNRDVIAQAIVKGAGTKDFFGTAYGEHDGKFDGFKYGDANVQFDDTLLLIASECATAYAEKMQASAVASVAPADAAIQVSPTSPLPTSGIPSITPTELKVTPESKAKSFHGSIEIAPATAKMKLLQVAEEIISALSEDPNAEIKVRLEIEADFPEGALDHLKRTISENAKTLGFRINEWE